LSLFSAVTFPREQQQKANKQASEKNKTKKTKRQPDPTRPQVGVLITDTIAVELEGIQKQSKGRVNLDVDYRRQQLNSKAIEGFINAPRKS